MPLYILLNENVVSRANNRGKTLFTSWDKGRLHKRGVKKKKEPQQNTGPEGLNAEGAD